MWPTFPKFCHRVDDAGSTDDSATWTKVLRTKRCKRPDNWNSRRIDHTDLAQRLTFTTSVDGLKCHEPLFDVSIEMSKR